MSYGFQGWDDYLKKAAETGLPKYLPVFNKASSYFEDFFYISTRTKSNIWFKALKNNGSNGFLVNNSLSLADIGLLECVLLCDELIGKDCLKPYPEVEV